MVTALGPWISVLMGECGMKERGISARKGATFLDPLECGGSQKNYIGHRGHSGCLSLNPEHSSLAFENPSESFSCYIPQARR